jgi:hypothetical protein
MITDLRSDTVTKPTAGMREAMFAAPVGDDVYGEDPEINALEAEVAALFGHEAALFVPSGTMGNQLALTLLVQPGEELVCDSDAHIVTYEQGAAAALFGISTRTVPSVRGLVDPEALAEQIRPPDWHIVTTRALAVENTHNRGGGTVQPLAALQRLRAIADATGVALHCDGARIWNAHVAAGCSTRCRSACPRGSARRSGRCWCRAPSGSPVPGSSASGSAAGCGRRGCSPRRAGTRWSTTSTGSRTTTSARSCSGRRWHRWGSARRPVTPTS